MDQHRRRGFEHRAHPGRASYPERPEQHRLAPDPRGSRAGGLTRDGSPRHPTEGHDVDVAPPFTSAYKVQDVASIAAGDDSPVYPVYWPTSGIVREIAGSILGAAAGAGMGSIGVEITVMDGREDIFKSAAASGSAGPDFNLYGSLFGYFGERRLYLQRPVYATLTWQVRFHNYHATTAFTPDLTFFLDEDPHGVRREHFRRISVPAGTEVAVYGGPGKRRILIAE